MRIGEGGQEKPSRMTAEIGSCFLELQKRRTPYEEQVREESGFPTSQVKNRPQ